MTTDTITVPKQELTEEQREARWKLMTEIATLHNTGKKAELMTHIGDNLELVDGYVLSMISNTIELTREFVTEHRELFTKLCALDFKMDDIRAAFRLSYLEALLEEIDSKEQENNSVETR
ncbi:MAG: hypothetical protein GY833_12765 [Aestuariibacter sp.]|nr:hypothetical protein [Aestuariibacter sp.]